MTSNGNNMMKDYLNEMQKYVMSSTEIYSKQNDIDDKGFSERQMNLDNSHIDNKVNPDLSNQMNNSNFDESILMNKDKLFETFMMFLNSQQSLKSSMTGVRTKDMNESQDFTHYQPNNMKKSLDLSIIDLDRSLDKHTLPGKSNINKEDATKFNRVQSNSININSYINADNKVVDNNLEMNISRNVQNDNYNENAEINYENNFIHITHTEEMPNINAGEVKSFDDIPIKPKTTNFLELLEQNLAKEENMRDNYDEGGDDLDVERIRRIRENKANNRRNSALRVQTAGETKKYKYYLQNFNKDFGKEDKADDNFEEIAPIEKKPAKFKYEDKKNKKTKLAAQKRTSIKQEKNTKNNNTNSTKVSNPSNYNTYNNESLKNSLPSNKRESGLIWDDKTQADNKADDFINSLQKPNMHKNKKQTVKEDILDISVLATNQDYEIKLVSGPSKVRMSVNKQNSKANKKPENVTKKQLGNTDNKDFKQYYQTNACNEIDMFKDKKISNLNIDECYKTNAVKLDNLNFDHLDLNELDDLSEEKEMQIAKVKEELHREKQINEETSKNKIDTNEINRDDSFNQDKEDIEDDGDDDRDIIRMYEEKVKNNSGKSNVREEKFDLIVKDDYLTFHKPEQSKIINKYFKPLMKEPNKSKPSDNFDSGTKSPTRNQINLTESNYQETVNEKINELNKEIEKMRKENEKVNKLKAEYERLTNKLNREIEEFHIKRQKETEDFELWKEEEIIKMEKDKKVHLRNTKLLHNMPNRKEREEIDLLKEQVLKLQEEMKAKDHRNRLANDRTKKQLEEALKKNEEKAKEIKYMEEMRVRNLQNSNSNSGNRNRAPSKNINIENPSSSNNDSNNISNVKSNSHLMNNKSKANLVSPLNRKIPVPKDKGSFRNNPNQQQARSSVRNNSMQYVPSDDKHAYDTFDDYAEDLKNERNSDNSNEDELDSSSVHKANDYFDMKNKSIQDDESEIKMNKGKVLKTANSIPKNDSRNTSFKQTEESVNKMNQIRSTIPSHSRVSDTAADNKRSSKKDHMSVSPKKKEKIEANYNILIKNREDHNEIYDMVFIDKYHGKGAQNVRLLKQEFSDDGKIIKLYENMKKVVRFPSGVVKELFEDGYQVTYFNNQDIKQVYPDKKEVYLFAENKTLQFKFPDGLHVFKFDGGLLEKHYPDGTKVVNYVDGRIRNVYPDGYEETFFPDGSLQKIDKNGLVTFDYEDGLKDTIYPDGLKIREFPDGKVIKVFPDGKIENYYK